MGNFFENEIRKANLLGRGNKLVFLLLGKLSREEMEPEMHLKAPGRLRCLQAQPVPGAPSLQHFPASPQHFQLLPFPCLCVFSAWIVQIHQKLLLWH